MKITCHSCAAKYTVSDEKVQGKTVKMKCRKCGATIVVGSAQHTDQGSQEEVSGGPDGGLDAGQDLAPGSFLVNVNDGDQRTMTLAEVVSAYGTGVVNGDTYVWSDGMADWQPLSENAQIMGAVGNGGGNGGAAYSPAPAAAAVPMATPSPRPGESNRPAARRDSGRRNDLFSGGMSDGNGLGASAMGAQAGRRDENSVLFSLNALTAAAAPAPSRSQTTATKEDSGLIDLKALAATAPAAPPAAAAVEPMGLFPLGAPVIAPPPTAVAAPSLAPPAEQKKSMVLPMVLGGALIVTAAAAVFFAMRGSAPAPAPTTTTAGETAAPTPTTPAPTQTAAQTAATPDTADTSPVASASGAASAKPPTGVGGNWKPPPKGTAPPPSTGGGNVKPPPPPPPKPGGACSCPPGDLMCAMQKCAGKH